VRKYLPRGGGGAGRDDQRWATFVRNHARAVVACDFTTVVTASFRTVYLFVVMELGSRRILRVATSEHPTAEWTAQQLREALPWEHGFAFLLHDRDAIFSKEFDGVASGLGLKVLRSPVRAPKANAYVERLIGTLRRECLDFLIPFSERHLAAIVREWAEHYNRGRPHSSLGPGLPQPPPGPPVALQEHRHRLPHGTKVARSPVLGGLHHEYRCQATPSLTR
jgi:transposase InsO family protein